MKAIFTVIVGRPCDCALSMKHFRIIVFLYRGGIFVICCLKEILYLNDCTVRLSVLMKLTFFGLRDASLSTSGYLVL
jgi:hypothetical protein